MSKPSKIYQFRYLGSFPPGQTDIDIYEVVTVQKWIIMPFSGWLYKIEVKLEPERISGMLCVTAKKDGIPVETNIVIDGDNPDQFSETYPPEDMYFFPSGSLFNIALISDSQWCVIDAGREERCKVIHVSAEFLVECGTGDWYKEIYGDSQRLLESDSRLQDARAQADDIEVLSRQPGVANLKAITNEQLIMAVLANQIRRSRIASDQFFASELEERAKKSDKLVCHVTTDPSWVPLSVKEIPATVTCVLCRKRYETKPMLMDKDGEPVCHDCARREDTHDNT